MKVIEVQNLSVSLDQTNILKDVRFDVEAGEMVGLIGPNGAGKSTLIRALVGLIRPDSGTLQILEKEPKEYKRKDFARALAYLPQGENIFWPILVERLVALGRIPHLMPWQALQEKDLLAIQKAMQDTDVIRLAKRSVHHLAGGEKALVMLARALAVEAKVILADEPVAGLDPHHEIQVMELLKGLTREGRSVVVVLHDLTLAARFCDRLFLIHQGKMQVSGRPHEVLSEEHLKNTYAIQAKYICDEKEFCVIPWKRLPVKEK